MSHFCDSGVSLLACICVCAFVCLQKIVLFLQWQYFKLKYMAALLCNYVFINELRVSQTHGSGECVCLRARVCE